MRSNEASLVGWLVAVDADDYASFEFEREKKCGGQPTITSTKSLFRMVIKNYFKAQINIKWSKLMSGLSMMRENRRYSLHTETIYKTLAARAVRCILFTLQ